MRARRMSLTDEEFTNLYTAHRDRLRAHMTGMVRDAAAADDLTAQAFADAWEHQGQFKGKASFYTWVYAIARNEALEALRTRRRHRTESLEALEENGRTSADDHGADHVHRLERDDESETLRRCVRCLPRPFRNAINDHYVKGWSLNRSAKARGIPRGTAGTRLFKAKNLLRNVWKRREELRSWKA
jgi:RNA polymerase sigma-70 factor, ECF subfamily